MSQSHRLSDVIEGGRLVGRVCSDGHRLLRFVPPIEWLQLCVTGCANAPMREDVGPYASVCV